MGRSYWLGACLLACAFVALAGDGPGAVRKQIEASMLVTGTVEVEADGSVSGHVLDHPEKLEVGVVGLVDRTLPTWRFEPVMENGEAHKATAKMSLLIVANKLDAEHFAVRIRSAHFRESAQAASDSISSKRMEPPQYPMEALFSGVRGTVYLVVRINREGYVADVAVEQVNLRTIDDERQMQHWRDVLAEPASKAARRWRFNLPTTGEHRDDAFWSARVPVDYLLEGDGLPKYGHWRPYVPGPRKPITWLNKAGEDIASSPEALAAGEIEQIGQGLHLLTPLGEG